jgi:uncharacterized protein YrrD
MRDIRTITGLRVIAKDEGLNVGTVSQVVIDLATGRMLGLVVGDGAGQRGVAAADIETIGVDAVMISKRAVAKLLTDLPEVDQFRRPAGAAPLQAVTQSGKRLGAVSAIFLDPLEKCVTRYEISGGPFKDLAEGILILPVVKEAIHGQDALILPDEAIAQVGRETGGLLARFSQLGELVKTQYQQAAETVEKAAADSAESLKKEAKVIKQRAGEVAEKTRKTVGDGTESLKKEADVIKQRAGEVAEKTRQTVVAHVEPLKPGTDKPAEEAPPEAEPAVKKPARRKIATHKEESAEPKADA